MKNVLALSSAILLVLAIFSAGCGTDSALGPETPEQPTAMALNFNMSKTTDYVPFGSTPSVILTGGSGQFIYELSRDAVVIGNNPLEYLRFDEVRDYTVNLKVTDLVTGEVLNKSVTVTGLEAPAGLPLSARLYVSDYFDEVPFSLSAMGIARGGVGNINHELIVNGQVIYEDDQGPLHINEVGENEIIYRATDAEGTVAEDAIMVSGFPAGEAPDFQGVYIMGDKRAPVGTPIFLAVVGMSGTPPYAARIKVDGEIISYNFMAIFTPTEARTYNLKFYLNDSNGEELVFQDTLDIYESDEYYIRPVDVTGTPHEAQQNESISFHADVRVLYDLVEWRVLGDDAIVGYSDNMIRSFPDVGFQHVEAQVFYQGNFVGADTTRVTITPADEPDPPTVDATAEPFKGPAPHHTHLHADVRNSSVHSIEWYVVGGVYLGAGEDLWHTFNEVQDHFIECRVLVEGEVAATDTCKVSVTDPDDPPPALTLDIMGGPQGLVEPVTVVLEAHPSGGDGDYSYAWYWPTADHLFSTERFPVNEGLTSGSHTFICRVTDGNGDTAEDEVVITVLEDLGPEIVTWVHCPDLRVGPSDDFASTTAMVELTGNYDSFVQIEWDALPAGTADAILVEVVRSDDHRYAWRFDKPSDWGRRTVYYEVGDLDLWSEEVTLNFYWLGDALDKGLKCDGWNKWQLISGNAEVPAAAGDNDVYVVRLDDPNHHNYVTQQ